MYTRNVLTYHFHFIYHINLLLTLYNSQKFTLSRIINYILKPQIVKYPTPR